MMQERLLSMLCSGKRVFFSFCVSIFSVTLNSCTLQKSDSKVQEKISFDESTEMMAGWERNYLKIPKQGKLSKLPWHGYYWPSVKGSIGANLKRNELSPVKKFEKVFETEIYQRVQNKNFISEILEKETRNRSQRWWGICNGVALASILLDEPKGEVFFRGETFHDYDIKALYSFFMAQANFLVDFSYIGQINHDFDVFSNRRASQAIARDANPGAFHLALSNLLAKNIPIIVDVESEPGIYFFPAQSFEVLNFSEVSDSEEIKSYKKIFKNFYKLVKVKTRVYFSDSHRVIQKIKDVDPTFYIDYEYMLEINVQDEITGGEWLNRSLDDHPDFIYWADWSKIYQNLKETLRLERSSEIKKLTVGDLLRQLSAAPTKNEETLFTQEELLNAYKARIYWLPENIIKLIKETGFNGGQVLWQDLPYDH